MVDANLINFESLLKNDLRLKSIAEPKQYVRGKYELWFFVEMIKSVENAIGVIYDELNIEEREYPKPRKKFEVNSANAFYLLASRIPIPSELHSFLNFNFKAINESN